jgi:hypothetical protein
MRKVGAMTSIRITLSAEKCIAKGGRKVCICPNLFRIGPGGTLIAHTQFLLRPAILTSYLQGDNMHLAWFFSYCVTE